MTVYFLASTLLAALGQTPRLRRSAEVDHHVIAELCMRRPSYGKTLTA